MEVEEAAANNKKINDTCFIISLSHWLPLLHRILPEDINECEIDNGNCSNGTCVNTNGSFHCSCHKDFILSEDDRYKCIRKYNKSDIETHLRAVIRTRYETWISFYTILALSRSLMTITIITIKFSLNKLTHCHQLSKIWKCS